VSTACAARRRVANFAVRVVAGLAQNRPASRVMNRRSVAAVRVQPSRQAPRRRLQAAPDLGYPVDLVARADHFEVDPRPPIAAVCSPEVEPS
jgi:hypothetical protein